MTAPSLVVIGIIDDGLAFAHQRFRRGKGTRVEYLWNQLLPGGPGVHLRKSVATTVPPIDTLLATCEHAGLVDEDELYCLSRQIDYRQSGHKPAAWRVSHGTLAMDLACGDDPASVQNDRPIVCVQLPVATTADTSGGTLKAQVMEALAFIVRSANQIAADRGLAPPPIVVNLSYGIFAGPHDGSGLLEAAIDDLIMAREAADNAALRVVLPSGNSYLSRCHARFSINAGRKKELHWRVQPDDRTESWLEIWLPPGLAGQQPAVSVEVITPSGLASGEIAQGMECPLTAGGSVIGRVANYGPGRGTNNRGRITIHLAPTASDDGAVAVAPPGRWRVVLKNKGANSVRPIDAWIQRDDNPYGYPRRGRQSRFDDPKYRRFSVHGREIERDADDDPAAYVKRGGTISAIATGSKTIVIGGYRRRDGHPANYSAGGPLLPAGRNPDAMAVSDDSVACRGVMAAGSRSSSTVAMYGTSVAAPIVARFIAEELLAGRRGDRQAVHDLAQALEAGAPWAEPTPPPERAGGGRLLFQPVAPVLPVRRVDE